MAKSTATPQKKKPESNLPEPVLSGRLFLGLLGLFVMIALPASGVGRFITKTSPETTESAAWTIGGTARVNLTVVAPDVERLACAYDQEFKLASGDTTACGFTAAHGERPQPEGTPVDDNGRLTLQPYRSTDGQLLLIPGLWAQPAVATRVHQEPYQGVPDRQISRFVVSCELKFHEKWPNVAVRWKPTEKWSNQGEAMVATPSSCEILKSRP